LKGEALTMAKQAVLKVSAGKTEEAIRGFLRSLLEKGLVEALLIPQGLPSGDGVVQTLIHDPEKLKGASVLAPTMPVQSARVASSLTAKNLGKKVAALLKACEIRAVVELTKFLQVKPENLYLIGIDCPGTFEVPDYAKMTQEGKGGETLFEEWIQGMEKGDVPPPELHARCVNILRHKPISFLNFLATRRIRRSALRLGNDLKGRSKKRGFCP
jgi:hypothetical protein